MDFFAGLIRSWPGYVAGLVLLHSPALILFQYPGPCWIVGLSLGGLGSFWLTVHTWMLHREHSRSKAESRFHGAQLEALVDSAADAILTCDDQGLILSANLVTGRLFGYRREDIIGKPLKQILSADTLHGLDTNQHRVLGIASAYKGRRQDGSTFPITVAVSKVRMDGQGIYTVIIHDQTALAQARDDAEAANRAKDAFLLGASHELRTPLTAILGTAELLANSPLMDNQKQLVSTLIKSGDVLLARVKQILDFSQLEMGQLRLKTEPFSLRSLLYNLETQLHPVATAKNLIFHIQCHTPLPPTLLGDGERLEQILDCLLRNALQFTDHGEVRVDVHYTEAHLEIAIQDTGAGIETIDQERVFRAFERATPLQEGMGLGLTLAARLTQMMGGQLHLVSAPGRGCRVQLRFRFELPITPPRPAVLLALPDAALRARIEALLLEMGYPSTTTTSGRHALAEIFHWAVLGQPFGLVVLDHTLPDMATEEWLVQAKACTGWNGAVVLLGYTHLAACPDGVLATVNRDDPSVALGQVVRQQLQGLMSV